MKLLCKEAARLAFKFLIFHFKSFHFFLSCEKKTQKPHAQKAAMILNFKRCIKPWPEKTQMRKGSMVRSYVPGNRATVKGLARITSVQENGNPKILSCARYFFSAMTLKFHYGGLSCFFYNLFSYSTVGSHSGIQHYFSRPCRVGQ